ncbi:hypothetical protein ACFW9I_36875 [[Kitasatospora] papulosa]|uniref:hypothetical protein n=1 Tax=[Kitasatospora] papulosa TaxID=1464011 RepID=UPI0036BE4D4E
MQQQMSHFAFTVGNYTFGDGAVAAPLTQEEERAIDRVLLRLGSGAFQQDEFWTATREEGEHADRAYWTILERYLIMTPRSNYMLHTVGQQRLAQALRSITAHMQPVLRGTPSLNRDREVARADSSHAAGRSRR